MKEVKMYVSYDGLMFDNKELCSKYERTKVEKDFNNIEHKIIKNNFISLFMDGYSYVVTPKNIQECSAIIEYFKMKDWDYMVEEESLNINEPNLFLVIEGRVIFSKEWCKDIAKLNAEINK